MDNIQYQKHRDRKYNKESKINARNEKHCNGNEEYLWWACDWIEPKNKSISLKMYH